MRLAPLLLLLVSCSSLPRMEVLGFDQGEHPRDWAPTIAYYGDDWPSFRPELSCALRQAPPRYGAGLVIEFRRDAECGYEPWTETITAPDFECARSLLQVRAADVLMEAPLQPCLSL